MKAGSSLSMGHKGLQLEYGGRGLGIPPKTLVEFGTMNSARCEMGGDPKTCKVGAGFVPQFLVHTFSCAVIHILISSSLDHGVSDHKAVCPLHMQGSLYFNLQPTCLPSHRPQYCRQLNIASWFTLFHTILRLLVQSIPSVKLTYPRVMPCTHFLVFATNAHAEEGGAKEGGRGGGGAGAAVGVGAKQATQCANHSPRDQLHTIISTLYHPTCDLGGGHLGGLDLWSVPVAMGGMQVLPWPHGLLFGGHVVLYACFALSLVPV